MSQEQSIDFSKILVARKFSKLEFWAHRDGKTLTELVAEYSKMGESGQRLLRGHKALHQGFQNVIEVLPKDVPTVAGESLNADQVKGKDLVIVVGGDNYLQYVSHFIEGQKVLGINPDSKLSEGNNLPFSPQTFRDFIERLKIGNYQVEEWTRMQVLLNGIKVWPLAIGEVVASAIRVNRDMSHYILEIPGFREEQKSNGVLISTGMGSTGYISSVMMERYQEIRPFPKDAQRIQFAAMFLYPGHLTGNTIREGEIQKGQSITLHSLTDRPAEMNIDSIADFPFQRGATVTVEIAKTPLKVITK